MSSHRRNIQNIWLILKYNWYYQSDVPVIVMGDFNDVSWSGSTQLTKTIGKLLDARIGRGVYATFSAQSWFMRWPLDHILSTSDFRYKNSGVGTSFGSDHFPLWTKFTLEPEKKDNQTADEPTQGEWEDAEMQLRNADMSVFTDLPKGLKNAMEQ
jgi:endonuclease/exonuclease/phosphatase family metal-dependent hydrolase